MSFIQDEFGFYCKGKIKDHILGLIVSEAMQNGGM